MTDIEQLLINLDGIAAHLESEELPTLAQTVRDARTRLIIGAPVEPMPHRSRVTWAKYWTCGACETLIGLQDNFCSLCGRRIKWEARGNG